MDQLMRQKHCTECETTTDDGETESEAKWWKSRLVFVGQLMFSLQLDFFLFSLGSQGTNEPICLALEILSKKISGFSFHFWKPAFVTQDQQMLCTLGKIIFKQNIVYALALHVQRAFTDMIAQKQWTVDVDIPPLFFLHSAQISSGLVRANHFGHATSLEIQTCTAFVCSGQNDLPQR